MRVLITGGAGYIGSHALLAVLAAGHEAHVLDQRRRKPLRQHSWLDAWRLQIEIAGVSRATLAADANAALFEQFSQ